MDRSVFDYIRVCTNSQMNMRNLIICLLGLTLSLHARGQTKVTSDAQKNIIEKIDKSVSAWTSMQCEFTQTKSMKMLKKDMVSKGMMYYKQPNQLRWQYTSPYDYVFVLNNDKVRIMSAKTTKNISVQENKMFRQITGIILKCVTGDGLKNTSDFTVEVYQADKSYFAKLYPKKKELKQIYSVIELHFNPSLTMVSSIKMVEKTGDVTWVRLSNVKPNATVNEKLFDVN